MLGLFAAPHLPEGFEAAMTVSPVSSFTASMAAFLGFAVKKTGTTSLTTSPAAPLPPTGSVSFDFDKDGKADVSRWRSSTGGWSVKSSSDGSITNYNLGTGREVSAPADYDGDSITDFAVFDASTGGWVIRESGNNEEVSIANFGQTGDKPTSGDFDGDGKADAAVYRPSNGTWYIRQSGNAGAIISVQFGVSGDIPVPGNYDGDSRMDCAVYRPATGDWHVLFSSTGSNGQFHWGISSDIPVPADYDGDNKTDFAVYRGSTGSWYAYKSSGTGQYISQTWGNYGDQPVPADYDGDGKAEFAVWRPTTGIWHLYKSCNYDNICEANNLAGYEYTQFGINGDVPIPASYVKQIASSVPGYDLAKARLSPKNATGATNFYSRNFSWGTGLVSLSGRAGLNAGFGIGYNSLIWTKQGSNIYFDADNSNISPGFRFGFPVIEPIYYDNTGSRTFNYLMVSPSGARTEFRQVYGASGTYETADSSYTQLKTTGASNPNEPVENITITVTGTDGTKMTFEWKAGAFRCSEIKDRNGNFITINHDEYGLLRTVTDTLGRIITVNYDSELYPVSITQTWKNNNGAGGEVAHTWATFTYTTTTINTGFSGLTVFGPSNGTVLKVLQKITSPNGNAVQFNYNTYGQVWKVSNIAADSPSHVLNYVRTNLEVPAANQADCPRFSETRLWTENFNPDSQGGAQEIVVTSSITENQAYNVPGASGTATLIETAMANHPHQVVSKTYVGNSGWQESLPIVTEDWANDAGQGLTRKRWTWTNWTQDNPNLSYVLNPRVTESKVGDAANIKRTTVEYYPAAQGSAVALYGLVKKIQLSDGITGTLLKESSTEYKMDAAYISRRIIGLPFKTEISGLNQATNALELVSKVTYDYDGYDFSDAALEQNIPAVIQHDNSNYGANFVIGRGNLTATTRHDVTGATPSVTSSIKYNTAGAPVARIDSLGRIVKISYADKFNDSASNRNTYAYATTLTDPAGNSSTVKYRFDIGANVWAKSPDLNADTEGKVSARMFDSIGRLQRESVFKGNQAYLNNQEHAYTRYEYPANSIQSKVYTTVVDIDADGADADDEVLSESWTDGAGRVLKSRSEHPNSTGGWSGSLVEYDILGRVKRSSVPTEINSSWTPAGEDAVRGWIWNSQQYDWKGRPTRIIPSDSTGNDGKDQLLSYDGCGCAGGQVTTIQSESVPVSGQNHFARRTQKVYQDILGRDYKTEVLNWDGSVYTTIVSTFNGGGQITGIRQYDGETSSSSYRDVTMTYDGHGRMKTRHYPIEDAQTETTWIYNADDSVQQVIDPRGVITNFAYNSRGLPETISYDTPPSSSIPDTPDVAFAYDALGNRIQMTDGTGSTSYVYNQVSQLVSETKAITELSNSYTINYTYNLTGGLKSVSDPLSPNHHVAYNHDKIGRVLGADEILQNAAVQNVADVKFRAWGAIKEYEYNRFTTSGTYTTQVNFDYDKRLLISEMQVGTDATEYLRYNDGKVMNADSLNYSRFRRYFEYDHVGRFTKGLSGAEAGSDPEIIDTPYRTNMSYNAFSDVTNINGKHWNATVPTFAPPIGSHTGRISTSSYDAAGNTTQERIRTYPSVLNRTLTYDAAGRQVQTFDPKLHSWENNVTVNNTYDGNGWMVKNERFNGSTEKFFEIRSTVLGGELVARLRYFDNYAPQKRFTAPIHGMKLTQDDVYGSGLEWTVPEGIFSHKMEGTAMLDPRGSDVGLENPYNTSGGDGGSSYPNYGDATSFARCSADGNPLSCQKLGSIVERSVYNMEVSGLLVPPGGSSAGPARHKATSAAAPASMRNSATAQAARATSKPSDDTQTGSMISVSSQPDVVWQCCDDSGNYYPVPQSYSGLVNPLFAGAELAGLQTQPRPLNQNEMKSFNSARARATEVLGNNANCRNAIAAILRIVAPESFGRDYTLTTRDGVTTNHSPLNDFIFKTEGSGKNRVETSEYLNKYDSVPMQASGRSGAKKGGTTIGTTPFKRNDLGIVVVNSPITWNKEFFNISPDARALHTLHEILHQYADDVEIANAVAVILNDRDKSGKVKTFDEDKDNASLYINEYLSSKKACNLPMQ